MKIQKLFKSLIVQVSVLAMLLTGFAILPSGSRMQDFLPNDEVSLPGAHGATNNTVFAYDRFVIVAPFAPSDGIGDGLDLSKLDNHYVYLYDTKRPDSAPKRADLKVCYFPTKVVFDPNTGNVFVRGTEFFEIEPGQFDTREVIVHVQLNLQPDGKPEFEPDFAVPIRIKKSETEYASEAPIDFALAFGGQLLVFSNGSSVFTYDVVSGRSYSIVIDSTNSLNRISFLDVDQSTNTAVVATTRKVGELEGVVSYTSDLYFLTLFRDGAINTYKWFKPEDFGKGVFLTAGSNVAISHDLVTGALEFGYFVTNDGSLCQVDLRSWDTPNVIERIGYLPEMAQVGGGEPGPITITFDRTKKLLTIIKRGAFWRIRIPSFVERLGRIRIPSFIQVDGTPAIAIVQLNKKNRVVGQRVFDKVFGKGSRISNLVAGQGTIGLVATYSGTLFSLDTASPLDSAGVNPIGTIGERIEQIAYNPARQNLTAISSCKFDEESREMLPGSIHFAKITLNSD